jgi:hypothetical protein
MNYDLDSYMQDLDNIANFLISNPFIVITDFFHNREKEISNEIPNEIKEKFKKAHDYRATIIDDNDFARVKPLVEGIEDEEQRKKNIVYFTFILDLQDLQKENDIRTRCKSYKLTDAIFNGTNLWDKLAMGDKDLVELSHEDEVNDEIIKIEEKYFRVDRSLSIGTIRFLKKLFIQYPQSKLWLRLACNEIYDTEPPHLFLEEAIIPADKFWWKTLAVYHNGKGKVAEYQNIDISLPENIDRFWDRKVKCIEKLQIEWHRKSEDLLSMMMEELPEMSLGNGKFKSSLLIHLTCRDKVGKNFNEAIIEHIDGALNVFFGNSIKDRANSKLSDKVKATLRIHLFRIENVHLNALLPIAYSFFEAKTLVKDWFKDQFNINNKQQ